MKSIINAVVVIAFLSFLVSCNNGDKQGNNDASNEQIAASAPARDAERNVNLDQLPKIAKDYIDKYLPGKEIVRVIADEDDIKVWFSTSEQLEFDIDGNIKEIECVAGIPASAIDERLMQDVKSIDPKASIVKIDKDSFGEYEVKLDNGMEINYDANFKRIGFDD